MSDNQLADITRRYSIASRHISTPDKVTVDPGPDRVVIVGRVDATDQTAQSTSFGLRYDQIDQLIIDLLAARRDHHGLAG